MAKTRALPRVDVPSLPGDPMNTRRIDLLNGRSALVDADVFEILNGTPWHVVARCYAASGVRVAGKKVCVYLHRVIMDAPTGVDIDHINGDTLDNRRANLRMASHGENIRNSKKPQNNTSGFKGVYWHKQAKKWLAQIKCEAKHHYLGLFDTAEEASLVYETAARKLFGEFYREIHHG